MICAYCGLEMTTADACTMAYIKFVKQNKIMRRDTACRGNEEQRCHDCGVKVGKHHHFGCDNEICTLCGEQAAFCDCGEFSLGKFKKDL